MGIKKLDFNCLEFKIPPRHASGDTYKPAENGNRELHGKVKTRVTNFGSKSP